MPLKWVQSRGVHSAFVGTLGLILVAPREPYGPDKTLRVKVFHQELDVAAPDIETGKEIAVAAAREVLTSAPDELS